MTLERTLPSRENKSLFTLRAWYNLSNNSSSHLFWTQSNSISSLNNKSNPNRWFSSQSSQCRGSHHNLLFHKCRITLINSTNICLRSFRLTANIRTNSFRLTIHRCLSNTTNTRDSTLLIMAKIFTSSNSNITNTCLNLKTWCHHPL